MIAIYLFFGESESDHGGKEKQLEGQKNMRDIFIIEDFKKKIIARKD